MHTLCRLHALVAFVLLLICCGTSFPRNGTETFISILRLTSSLPSHNPPTATPGFKSDLYGHLVKKPQNGRDILMFISTLQEENSVNP